MFNDEEDESAVGAVRYPCMPSLVALQQMRNRLHLAYLGRKLMKWSALATGRELRRLSGQILKVYDSFSEDLGNAYMLLARGRYFYPNLNKMVLENFPPQASVTVTSKTRTVSGVKCIQYEVIESGSEPYEHLGIEKGGQQIHEAKIAWLELLKRVILMLELRKSFIAVDLAHMNATKRSNAIRKIVIPRTQVTILYILIELEEMGREELFRIKLIKKKKARAAQVKKKKKEVCPICNMEFDVEDPQKHKDEIDSKYKAKVATEPKVIVQDVKPQQLPPQPMQAPKPIMAPKPAVAPSPLPAAPPPPLKVTLPEAAVADKIIIEMPQRVESVKSIYRPPSARELDNLTRVLSVGPTDEDSRLEYLKKLLAEIIALGRDMVESGVNKIDMDEFMKICEEAKNRIDNYVGDKEQTTSQVDENLQNRLLHLKSHLREVIDLTQDFRNETLLTGSVEHFIETCEEVDEKLDVYMKNVESKPISDDTQARLDYLKQHIKDVVEMTEDYKLQGLLTPSVEDFIKSCKSVQSKIESYKQEPSANIDVERLNHLKDHVGQLEKITTDIKHEGMTSSSLEKFLISCKDFKTRLEEYKKKAKMPRRATLGDLNKLADQIEETMDLGTLAKEEGLISESVDEFIKCCEDMKKQLEPKSVGEERPQTLGKLRTNIDGVIKSIKDLKAEGLITESVEDFLETCELAKGKIDVYERYPITESKMRTTTVPCSEKCTCEEGKEEQPDDEEGVCENCEKMMKEPLKPVLPYVVEPCDSCRGLVKYEAEEEYPCDSCSQVIEPNLCSHCKESKSEEEVCPAIECPLHPTPPPEEPKPPSPVDSSLGYFEKNIKKITRVTRSLNEDGTIREETETIIIRKNRHDPTETSLEEDDYDEEGDAASFEDIPEDETCCALCLNLNQNQLGFRRAKSEEIVKFPSMAEPNLRNCLSIHMYLKDSILPGFDYESVNYTQPF